MEPNVELNLMKPNKYEPVRGKTTQVYFPTFTANEKNILQLDTFLFLKTFYQ